MDASAYDDVWHAQGEWFCSACTERGCVPKAKQISPVKKQKPKLEKAIARSASKSAGAPKKSSGPAKKSALSVGPVKSRPATGESDFNDKILYHMR